MDEIPLRAGYGSPGLMARDESRFRMKNVQSCGATLVVGVVLSGKR
jgi:hypothetical protein